VSSNLCSARLLMPRSRCALESSRNIHQVTVQKCPEAVLSATCPHRRLDPDYQEREAGGLIVEIMGTRQGAIGNVD
jgi:hypothetical protein